MSEIWHGLLLALLVGVAAGAGSVIRAALSDLRGLLGWGILTANTLAGAGLGLLLALPMDSSIFTLATVGLLGGLSTFSGVAGDAFYFWNRGRLIQLLMTLAANLLLPLAALWIVRNLLVGEW